MTSSSKYCSECGAQFLPNAAYCHNCGAPKGDTTNAPHVQSGLSPKLKWGVPGVALAALLLLTLFRLGGSDPETPAGAPLSSGAMRAPDISSMSPSEQADRLFNRVMTYASAGKADSAEFFAPMAIAAFEALAPMTAHARYDLGLIALVSGDIAKASAQSESILRERPTHLLGLSLAARVADARNDAAAGKSYRQQMIASETAERAAGLAEYTDHDADLRAAMDSARSR